MKERTTININIVHQVFHRSSPLLSYGDVMKIKFDIGEYSLFLLFFFRFLAWFIPQLLSLMPIDFKALMDWLAFCIPSTWYWNWHPVIPHTHAKFGSISIDEFPLTCSFKYLNQYIIVTDITAIKTSKSRVVVCFLETLSQSLNQLNTLHWSLIIHLVIPANRVYRCN